MALNFANNNSLSAITLLPASISGGGMTLISEQTASSSASLQFSLDDSYDSYIFKFINIHPITDNGDFEFNFSTDNGSNYNVTKTSTFFKAEQYEDGSYSVLTYDGGRDLAQSTGNQFMNNAIGNDSDQSISGYLKVFNPSSSTFVKHFIGVTNGSGKDNATRNPYIAGYGNTVSPITNIRFSMDNGNFNGIIKMYGVA
jgi:hypothetical protein